MTDAAAHLEYIGQMADQLADISRELEQHELAALLREAADRADREWLAKRTARGAAQNFLGAGSPPFVDLKTLSA